MFVKCQSKAPLFWQYALENYQIADIKCSFETKQKRNTKWESQVFLIK